MPQMHYPGSSSVVCRTETFYLVISECFNGNVCNSQIVAVQLPIYDCFREKLNSRSRACVIMRPS